MGLNGERFFMDSPRGGEMAAATTFTKPAKVFRCPNLSLHNM